MYYKYMYHTWKRVCILEEFWNVLLLMTEFDHPEVTLWGQQDIKIQLLTIQGHGHSDGSYNQNIFFSTM